MRKLLFVLGIVLGIVIAMSYGISQSYAAPFPYAVGGTGSSTLPTIGQVFYAGPTAWQSEATGTITCTGSSSCGAGSYVLGNALTITTSGGTGGLSTTTPIGNNYVLVYTNTGAGAAYGYATSSVSSAYRDVWRDANQNAFAQNFVSAGTSFPSNGGTVTLTNASPRTWIFTGSNTETMKLPSATTLTIGTTFSANNNATGVVTVIDNGSNVLATVLPGGSAQFIASSTATSNGVWDSHASLGHQVYSGTNVFSVGSTSPFATLSVHANPTDSTLYNTLFAIGSSTATATSTLFSINNIGSTTLASTFGACSGTNALTTNSSGTIVCGAISSTGAAFPFTPTTNYAQNVNSTSTPIWDTAGFMSSSTIYGTVASGGTAFDVQGTGAGTNKSIIKFTDISGDKFRIYYGTGNTFYLSGLTNTPFILNTNNGGTSNGLELSGTASDVSVLSSSRFTVVSGLSTLGGGFLSSASSTINANATTTGTFFASIASSTNLFGANLGSCNGASNALTWSAGLFGCNTITAGAAFPFTPTSAFGANSNATSTPMLFTANLFASSTVNFGNAGVKNQFHWDGSLGSLGLGSSTPFSTLSVGSGTASSSITVAEYKYGVAGNVATSTSANIDCNASTQIAWPIGTSATTLTLINLTPGKKCIVVVQNPNASAGAITWKVGTGILKWAGGTTPTQTTTANAMDVWSFLTTAGSSTIQVNGAMSANF